MYLFTKQLIVRGKGTHIKKASRSMRGKETYIKKASQFVRSKEGHIKKALRSVRDIKYHFSIPSISGNFHARRKLRSYLNPAQKNS